ncbi:hypothetical protein V2J09_006304 [Rumex salicifolius]
MWSRSSCRFRDIINGTELLILMFLALCLAWPVRSEDITHPDEVSALLAIKSLLSDPMENLKNWRKHGDPCTANWTGITCYNKTLEDGELLKMNLSGTLAPELGQLSQLKILDFMWNTIEGSIPKEIGNLTNLKLLLLNGNQLTGSLPDELGYLPHLDRIQIDQNNISGPLPKSFANLNKTKHFHMNNNSISGEIPHELSRLPNLVHFLLDNNNLSGSLPPEFSDLPNLMILQLDNNNFEGSEIPPSYGNMAKLLKLSLRNCSLQGSIPDLSRIPSLAYIDLGYNNLSGPVPSEKLSDDMTTIILSNNSLNGSIPINLTRLPQLQRLLLDNNSFSGSVPSTIWQSRSLTAAATLILDFRNNRLVDISGSSSVPPNVTLLLGGNPLCSNASSGGLYCGSLTQYDNTQALSYFTNVCQAGVCPPPYEYPPMAPGSSCYCAAPLIIDYRLKSPGFRDFLPYMIGFEQYLTHGLTISFYQLNITSIAWQDGPRLKMNLKVFPAFDANSSKDHLFNSSELRRIVDMFTGWNIPDNDTFGPYELLGFTLLDPYDKELNPESASSGLSNGALAGIILGSVVGAVIFSAIISILFIKRYMRKHPATSKRRKMSRIIIKVDGVRDFTYEEMALATGHFSTSAQVGQGGYGKVYKGVLADGLTVAIKRAQEGSLQGDKEFLTEIELLSRLHHRHLVSLIGYCDEEGEQMLVYEFMPNLTLRDHLSAKAKQPLNFAARLSIALGSARGILYLHTEADPPIFHRDIKSTNILLDSKFSAKVADFGLSRLAPIADTYGVIPNHVSTVVKGTPGYLDPEYFLTHKLTDKSDVYSLGVVLLELLTGMHPISHGKNIVREVNTAYRSGELFSVVDQRMGAYQVECVEALASLALRCCQDDPDRRPTVAEIVRTLENIVQMIPPESDTKSTTDTSSNVGAKGRDTTPSSSDTSKNPFLSMDLSGSYLDSGIFPSIPPR